MTHRILLNRRLTMTSGRQAAMHRQPTSYDEMLRITAGEAAEIGG